MPKNIGPTVTELRKRARKELAPLLDKVWPVLIRYGSHGERGVETTVVDGPNPSDVRRVVLIFDLDAIGRESPDARRIIEELLVRLMDQADVANRAVALANLGLGKHDRKKSVERKKKNAQPMDDLLWQRAVELLRINRRHSYSELGMMIVDKYSEHGTSSDWVRRKLRDMLGRPPIRSGGK